MTALKGAEGERFIKNPDPLKQIVLIFGQDSGLVRERSKLLRSKWGGEKSDFSEITLDSSTLAADPPRLLDEATTISLFGDKRIIRVLAETGAITDSVKMLMDVPKLEANIVIEAGDLKPTQALRALVEKSASLIAIPCYQDSFQDLARLVEVEISQAGLRITPLARDMLMAQLGGDRALSRQEIAKLLLYVMGEKEITEQHVKDILCDASDSSLDDILDPLFMGQVDKALAEFNKIKTSKEGIVPLILALIRHAVMLMNARIKIESGASISSYIENPANRIHFARKPAIEQQLKLWSAAKLSEKIEKIHTMLAESRLNTAQANIIVERVLLNIALQARRK